MNEADTYPLVSIIMATYNRGHLIMDTINSICEQTYGNWELIIVDDGSEDNTEGLIQQLGDERIRFHKAGHVGIGGKLKNTGLTLASGELIAFTDSDDLWHPQKIGSQVDALLDYPNAGFCLTGGYNFEIPGIPKEYFYKQVSGLKYDHLFDAIFDSQIAVFTQALMIRRSSLETVGHFIEQGSFSDMDFIARLAYHHKAVLLYEPMFFRRLHQQNYIHSNWEKSFYEGVELIGRFRRDGMLQPKAARTALYRLYINFGEKLLLHKKPNKAFTVFTKAWLQAPFNIVPIKKMSKALLQNFIF